MTSRTKPPRSPTRVGTATSASSPAIWASSRRKRVRSCPESSPVLRLELRQGALLAGARARDLQVQVAAEDPARGHDHHRPEAQGHEPLDLEAAVENDQQRAEDRPGRCGRPASGRAAPAAAAPPPACGPSRGASGPSSRSRRGRACGRRSRPPSTASSPRGGPARGAGCGRSRRPAASTARTAAALERWRAIRPPRQSPVRWDTPASPVRCECSFERLGCPVGANG